MKRLRHKHSLTHAVAAAALLLLSGCADLGYYLQSIDGQMQLNAARRPLAEVVADADTPEALKHLGVG